jgi:uncharacterized membrane protein YphA (DoxX/SURF4 family)
MRDLKRDDPVWVDAILDWKWTWLIARTLMVGLFVVSGVMKLLNFAEAKVEHEAFGLHPAGFWAGLTIAVQLVASALVIAGRFVWLGASALAVFTAITAFLAYAFWTMQGEARFIAMNSFLEHFALIGGFIMTALIAEHTKRDGRYY